MTSWIPFDGLMKEDVDRVRDDDGKKNLRFYKSFHDPESSRTEFFKAAGKKPDLSPMMFIILAFCGEEPGKSQVTIFPEVNPEESVRREGGDPAGYNRYADYSATDHAAVRFSTTTGGSNVLVDLCCEEVSPGEVDWYFRFTSSHWGYTYYLWNWQMSDVVIWALNTLRDRIESEEQLERYSHIYGWENLDRCLHLSHLSGDQQDIEDIDDIEDWGACLLWGVFCEEWLSMHHCMFTDDVSNEIKIKFRPGESLEIYCNGKKEADFPDLLRAVIYDHIKLIGESYSPLLAPPMYEAPPSY